MSVIQKIRDKYAKISVVLIALALLGFILMDYGKSRGLFGGGQANVVGRVNGTKIVIEDFRKKVKQLEDNLQQQSGSISEESRQRAIEQTWDMEVSRVLVTSETDKLGMRVESKELNDIMFGKNIPDDIKRIGTDQQTGQYNGTLAVQRINEVKKRGTAEEKAMLNSYINQLGLQRLAEKYTSLLSVSAYFPKWFVEKTNADNSLVAKISYVRMLYTDSSFVDSTLKISDKEIAEYISKHKEEFKIGESRSIAYVSFSAAANATDTGAIKKQVEALRPEFDTTANIETFLVRNASSISFFDGYTGKTKMQMQYKDSIQKMAKNQVFGPYLDGGMYAMAKMLDTKELPDSVRCRHILLGTTNPQTGQQTGNDSLAHKIADSIAMVISKGGNFDTLETQFTTDQVAHKDKGVMTFSSDQIQGEGFAKEFGQFILFDGKPGDKKVVKTSFGWHYIEILGFIKPETHYKVAYMAKAVVPSSETDRDANNTASQFASDSRSLKSFDVNFEKNLKPKGLNKMFGNDIKPNDYEVMGIGTSRQFVKDIYSADMGDVMQPERIGDQYVVAAITEINKEGTAGVTKARSYVEPILRNKKKAELVEKKTGKITTLEAAAATLGKQIETKDSLRMTTGFDIKITGATFNPANKSKVVSELIEGSGALFVLRVDNVTATALETANVSEQQKTMYQSSRQGVEYPDPRNPGYPINVLRRAATIKDNRAKFY